MKKNLLKLLLIAGLNCGGLAGNAYDFESNGVYYNINAADKTTVSVTYKDTKYASYSGDVVIPATVSNDGTTYTVTSLGKYSIRNSAELTSIQLPESLLSIEMGAFSKCNKLKKLVVPNSVTTIGNLAIQDNPALEELILGTGITTIGTGAFMGDIALKEIIIPQGVTDLTANAFANCTGLTKVNIPANVKSINGGAFAGCIQLMDFTVDAANQSFVAVDGVLYSKDMSILVVYPGGRTAEEFTVPDGVKELGFKAFSQHVITVSGYEVYDTNLKKINLPNSLEKLGNSCFQYLVAMEAITLPESVNWVGNATFGNCTALKSITLPEAVTTIDVSGFNGCKVLTDVVMGSKVTTIGGTAFKGCAALKNVTVTATVPPTVKSTSFDATVSAATLTVPSSSVDAYKDAEVWKTFGSIQGGANVVELEVGAAANVIGIFDMNGVSHDSPVSGINIIRMSDGSTRKVMIK